MKQNIKTVGLNKIINMTTTTMMMMMMMIIIIIIIQFMFINVPSQQPDGQLQQQRNIET